MPSRRVLIFANPTSGRGRGTGIARKLQPVLAENGWTVDTFLQHPQKLREIPNAASIAAMIVIGGDGTLRAVIERVMELVGADNVPPVLVMGLGTANLMQQHLKLRYRRVGLEQDVMELLEARKTVKVDTAVAGRSLFLLMASCGFDSSVVKRLAAGRTGPITKLSYVTPILASLHDYDFPPLTVEVDGQIVHDNQPAQVYVGNVPEYGTGFPVLDLASSFDQRLDICVMPCQTRNDLIRLSMLTLVGKHRDASGVIYTTGRDVRITSDLPVPIQVDGDDAGSTPVHIHLLDTSVAFIVR